MGKLLAIVLLIIALASAYPIVTNMFELPKDISTHGHAIDEQIKGTLLEAGFEHGALDLFIDGVPVRRDILWQLEHVGDNRVRGSQSDDQQNDR